MSHEPFGLRVHSLDLLAALGQLRELLLHLTTLLADARLLGGEEIEGNRVGIRHLHQLEPLSVESCQARLRPRPLLDTILAFGGELGPQSTPHSVSIDLIESYPARPGVFQALLEVGRAEVGQRAAALAVAATRPLPLA